MLSDVVPSPVLKESTTGVKHVCNRKLNLSAAPPVGGAVVQPVLGVLISLHPDGALGSETPEIQKIF